MQCPRLASRTAPGRHCRELNSPLVAGGEEERPHSALPSLPQAMTSASASIPARTDGCSHPNQRQRHQTTLSLSLPIDRLHLRPQQSLDQSITRSSERSSLCSLQPPPWEALSHQMEGNCGMGWDELQHHSDTWTPTHSPAPTLEPAWILHVPPQSSSSLQELLGDNTCLRH